MGSREQVCSKKITPKMKYKFQCHLEGPKGHPSSSWVEFVWLSGWLWLAAVVFVVVVKKLCGRKEERGWFRRPCGRVGTPLEELMRGIADRNCIPPLGWLNCRAVAAVERLVMVGTWIGLPGTIPTTLEESIFIRSLFLSSSSSSLGRLLAGTESLSSLSSRIVSKVTVRG